MMEKFKYLQRLARRWGGSLNLVTRETYVALPSTVGASPFEKLHAVDWDNRAVYVVIGHIKLPNIIHELGHVFASPHHPNSSRCTEIPWLGWEFLLARRLNILREWYKDYANYGLGYLFHGYDMDELTSDERALVLRKAVRLSRAYRVVKGNKPVPHPKRGLK